MNVTIVQLFLLRSAYQLGLKTNKAGLDLSLLTNYHNLNIFHSKFSYFTSEFLNIPLKSANLLISNTKFDHFLAPSLTISSDSIMIKDKTYHEHVVFPTTASKLRLKRCMWSNFLSTSNNGGCFGIKGLRQVEISDCSFLNIAIYTESTTVKGAFMIETDNSADSDDSYQFEFTNNLMTNISSTSPLNDSIYHAFYVVIQGSSSFCSNSIALYSKGGSYSCLLRSLASTVISYSNFTNCECKTGSGLNVEFYDQSSTKIRYLLLSKLGGLEVLRLSCAEEALAHTFSESKSALVFIEHVSFVDNDCDFLISLNNNIAKPTDGDFGANFCIRFCCISSQFFCNSNATYPFYVKVPKANVFSVPQFAGCVSDEELEVQPEIRDMFWYALASGWTVVDRPDCQPPITEMLPTLADEETVTETQKVTDSLRTETSDEQEESFNAPAPPTAAEPTGGIDDRVVVVKEGENFTITDTTTSVLVESVASINIENMKTVQFSSLGSSPQKSSEINLFGEGIQQAEDSHQGAEITVTDFSSVKINVFNSGNKISLPMVVSEVSDFQINNGFAKGQSEGEINIKRIWAPTKTDDLTSHITSNSKLNVKYISFYSQNYAGKKRLHQVVTSHSSITASVEAVLILDNIEADLVNFTVRDKICLFHNSMLNLKQSNVNFRTIIEFDIDSLNEIGQISIENPKSAKTLDEPKYTFSPNEITVYINGNKDTDAKKPIVKGLSEENCKRLFVNFQPQANIQGYKYKSSCEGDQLFVSIESVPETQKKSGGLNKGFIAVFVVGCIVVVVVVIVIVYLTKRKSSKVIIDPSDQFDVSVGSK